MKMLKDAGEFYFDFLIENWDIRSRTTSDNNMKKVYENLMLNYVHKYQASSGVIASALSLLLRTDKNSILEEIMSNTSILKDTNSLKEYFAGKYSLWAKRSSNPDVYQFLIDRHQQMTEEMWEETMKRISASLEWKVTPKVPKGKKLKTTILDSGERKQESSEENSKDGLVSEQNDEVEELKELEEVKEIHKQKNKKDKKDKKKEKKAEKIKKAKSDEANKSGNSKNEQNEEDRQNTQVTGKPVRKRPVRNPKQ